eukprot:scaffold1089_cov117-Cylindrotheca_fusiformis.AAC.14
MDCVDGFHHQDDLTAGQIILHVDVSLISSFGCFRGAALNRAKETHFILKYSRLHLVLNVR